MKQIVNTNANFKAYLTNPTVSRGAKVNMVDQAFDANSKTSTVSKNLLLTMAGNARLGDTGKVRLLRFFNLASAKTAALPSAVVRQFSYAVGREERKKRGFSAKEAFVAFLCR